MTDDPNTHLGLLIVDLQDSLLNVIPSSKALLNRCVFALEAAKLLSCHIAITEQSPKKLGPTHATIQSSLPEYTPVFEKTGFSAFDAEGLGRWIETNQIDHLLIAGIESPICIYKTALHALSDGLGVTLLADCIGERRIEDRQPVFQQLLNMEAHILPSETIFYSLLGDAQNPAFKAFTALVKKHTTKVSV
jgi:nicotinamidase-related amidase